MLRAIGKTRSGCGRNVLRLLAAVALAVLLSSVRGGPWSQRLDAADDSTLVTLHGATGGVLGCNRAQVEIWIENVTGLYAADVRVRFDPTVLEVVDMAPGSYGTQIEPSSTLLKPDFVVRKVACSAVDPADPICADPAQLGLIWYAASQMSPTLPVNGSGPIARITFQATAGGVSELAIIYRKLVRSNGTEIPAEIENSVMAASPPDAPLVSIRRLSALAARLNWGVISAAADYQVYRDTAPYLAPAEPPFGTTTGTRYDDPNAIGSTAVEYYYVVRSACRNNFQSANSNRVAGFDFALVPGTP